MIYFNYSNDIKKFNNIIIDLNFYDEDIKSSGLF